MSRCRGLSPFPSLKTGPSHPPTPGFLLLSAIVHERGIATCDGGGAGPPALPPEHGFAPHCSIAFVAVAIIVAVQAHLFPWRHFPGQVTNPHPAPERW